MSVQWGMFSCWEQKSTHAHCTGLSACSTQTGSALTQWGLLYCLYLPLSQQDRQHRQGLSKPFFFNLIWTMVAGIWWQASFCNKISTWLNFYWKFIMSSYQLCRRAELIWWHILSWINKLTSTLCVYETDCHTVRAKTKATESITNPPYVTCQMSRPLEKPSIFLVAATYRSRSLEDAHWPRCVSARRQR